MGGRMQGIQEQMKAERVVGTAGGGMVEVEANGAGEILRLSIDPAFDTVRDHPRYLALKADYEAWAAN